MLIYEDTKQGFEEDVLNDRIVKEIKQGHENKGLGIGSENEVRSWQNSFQFMHKVLSGSDIPEDAGVAIEFKVPLTSKRVDFIISGYDENGDGEVIVVELKQWGGESTEIVEGADGVVKTYVGNGVRETTHPSYQAWSYSQFIRDFNLTVQKENINIDPLAYLHNFDKEYKDVIENDVYQEYTEKAPLYLKGDAKKLRSYLEEQISEGDDRKNIYKINDGQIRPSKSLQDSLLGMLESKDEFTLIDTQKVVFEKAVQFAKRSQEDDQKRVMIVEGGPGTGKTVVAINILAELIGEDMMAQYVSKNRTPREVYKQKLKGDKMVKEIENLFTGSGGFYNVDENSIPALIADEAHRLNEETGFLGKGENQIMEIINAAKFSVFFIDESQRVHINDIGSKEEIRKHAGEAGAEIIKMDLESQFRCNGTEGYNAWLDDVLGIRETANRQEIGKEYDLKVFDSPQKLHDAIEQKNEETRLSRVVAGYCWEWDKEGRGESAYYDIEIGDYKKSWNREGGQPWAIESVSIEEVGCIHTCQGLEFDYVGVIIGQDLKYRNGQVIVDHEERASTDRSLFGIKKMFDENPEKASELAEEIIKNTYRTLMSRGMKGCYIYCCDDQLQEYMKNRISNMRQD
ncbi:MAG: DNA/RNA helicase domain-containing protein [Candidatus Nanohaloarchaea archaeon]